MSLFCSLMFKCLIKLQKGEGEEILREDKIIDELSFALNADLAKYFKIIYELVF